jgi:hypothetical protein
MPHLSVIARSPICGGDEAISWGNGDCHVLHVVKDSQRQTIGRRVLAFRRFDFVCNLDFVIWVFPWNLVLGIYPFVSGCLTMAFVSPFL